MRVTRKQAQDLAIKLAKEFMSSRDTKGWEWKVLGASPDNLAPKQDRKIFTRYSVLVEYSKKGAVLDGPGVVEVDIAKHECRFVKSP